MNGIAAIRSYVDRLVVGDGKCRGMKVLLLDGATTQIVSCAVSQTEILAKEVYLVTRLDSGRSHKEADVAWGDDDGNLELSETNYSSMSHLKAVCFVRPTADNIELLMQELERPRFSEYHLYFSGQLSTGLLRRLAEHDPLELVRQVQEFYADFLAINEDLLTLNCRDTIAMTVTAGTAWARDHAPLYQRHKDGLSSILLALKRKPAAIRYQQVRCTIVSTSYFKSACCSEHFSFVTISPLHLHNS